MITVTHSGATVMPLRPLSVLAAAAVAAISVAGGCADEQPATPAPKAPTTSGLLPTSVPTEGTRPPADALPPPAEPQAAPAQTAPIAGRLIPVGSAPEGVVVDAVTRTVAVAKRNPNELVLLNADTGADHDRTQHGRTEEHTPAKYEVEIVTTWLIVGIPLAYGVFNAVKAALQLFS